MQSFHNNQKYIIEIADTFYRQNRWCGFFGLMDACFRTERAFLKSERTERLWSRGILETPVECATV